MHSRLLKGAEVWLYQWAERWANPWSVSPLIHHTTTITQFCHHPLFNWELFKCLIMLSQCLNSTCKPIPFTFMQLMSDVKAGLHPCLSFQAKGGKFWDDKVLIDFWQCQWFLSFLKVHFDIFLDVLPVVNSLTWPLNNIVKVRFTFLIKIMPTICFLFRNISKISTHLAITGSWWIWQHRGRLSAICGGWRTRNSSWFHNSHDCVQRSWYFSSLGRWNGCESQISEGWLILICFSIMLLCALWLAHGVRTLHVLLGLCCSLASEPSSTDSNVNGHFLAFSTLSGNQSRSLSSSSTKNSTMLSVRSFVLNSNSSSISPNSLLSNWPSNVS